MSSAKNTSYLRGAAILAATVIITKIIGMIYKIPLYNLLGDEGTAHFQVTYTIYNLLLTLSTAGIPVALSRLIAAAAATNRPQQVKRYFSVGLSAFSVIGIAGMLIMFFFAQSLANMMGNPQVADGVRALAPAVLFACLVSVYRGYAQGHADMVPTAISQLLEVLCKLVFGISIAWYLASRNMDSATIAAGAIIGVTVGLGLAVPVMFFYKLRIDRRMAAPTAALDIPKSRGETLRQIFAIGIPITLSASILNIITLIDTKLVLLRLQTGAGFDFEMAKVLYGVYSKGLTLFNVPAAFIVPLTVSVVPAISAAIARRNGYEAKRVMESSLKVTNLFALPAAVGLCVLAYPIFNVLFAGSNENGPGLLSVLAIASFFVCTQLMTNAILQANGYENLVLLSLPVGGVAKILVNWVLVGTPSINIMGAPVGTLAAYFIITVMNVIFITVKIKDHPNFFKILIRPLLCAVAMGAAAWSVYELLWKMIGGGRLMMIVCLAAGILTGVAVYGILVIVTRILTIEDMKLIPKGEKIAKILKIK